MNFKVGDRVRIKSIDECDDVFDWFNRDEMEKFCEKETIISAILEVPYIDDEDYKYNYPNGLMYHLHISDTSYQYKWNCECFERIYNTRLMETE